MNSTVFRFQTDWAKIGFGLALILLSTWFLADFSKRADLETGDDLIYMTRYLGPPMALHQKMWAPLYSGFFAVLAAFVHDRLHLADIATLLLLIGPGIFSYVFLSRRGVHPGLAFGVCLLGLYSLANCHTWPRINHFLVIWMALGLALSARREDMRFRDLALFLSPTLLIRPECWIPVLVFFYRGWKEGEKDGKPSTTRARLREAAYLYVPLVFMGLSFSGQLLQNRDALAFVHHYALTKHKAGATAIPDPFLNAERIFSTDFPLPMGFPEALVRNPPAVIRHLWANFWFFLDQIKNWVKDLAFPATLLEGKSGFIPVLWVGLLAGWGMLIWRRAREKDRVEVPVLRQGFRKEWEIVLWMALPFLAVSLVFHPRGHYTLPVFWIGLWLLALKANSWMGQGTATILGIALLVWALIFRPQLPVHPQWLGLKKRQTLEGIRQAGLSGGGLVATGEHYEGFLGNQFHEVSTRVKKGKDLPSYLKENQVKLVVINRGFRSRMQLDERWLDLYVHPGLYGFRSVPGPGNGDSLLVRIRN